MVGARFIVPMDLRLEGLGYLGFDTTFTSLVWPDRENWQRTFLSGNPTNDGNPLPSKFYTLTFDVGNTWYDCLCILEIGQ